MTDYDMIIYLSQKLTHWVRYAHYTPEGDV